MVLITQLLPWQLPCTWFDDRHYIRAFVDRFKFKLTMSLFIFLNIPQKLKRLSPGFILRTGGPLMSQSKRQTHWHQKEMAFGKGDLTHPAEWPTNCDHSTKSTARRAFSLWSHPVCPRKQRRVILCCNTGSSWDVKSLEMEKHITYPVECYQGCTSQNRKMTNSMNLAEGFINYPVDNHCRTLGAILVSVPPGNTAYESVFSAGKEMSSCISTLSAMTQGFVRSVHHDVILNEAG